MNANDAILVIEAAAKYKVRELKLGDLHFVFDDMFRIASDASPEDNARDLAQNEYNVKSEELETLKLTDPVTYERVMAGDKDIA